MLDRFFVEVLVMAEDERIRANRIALSKTLGRDFLRLADLSKLQIEGRTRMTETKYVYSFGGGTAEGRADMKNLLGGKGANLAEMANLGIPVPAGFTLTTEVCTYYYDHGRTLPRHARGARSTPPSRRSSRSWARSSATRTTRCWCRSAPAPGRRCRA